MVQTIDKDQWVVCYEIWKHNKARTEDVWQIQYYHIWFVSLKPGDRFENRLGLINASFSDM
jgi:hypothetical protein